MTRAHTQGGRRPMSEIAIAGTQVAAPAPRQLISGRQRCQPRVLEGSVRFTKKKAVAALGVAAVLGGSYAAYAYWTAGGSGSGGATATTPVALVVNQTNAAITNLFPGGPTQALSGNFDNSNSG